MDGGRALNFFQMGNEIEKFELLRVVEWLIE